MTLLPSGVPDLEFVAEGALYPNGCLQTAIEFLHAVRGFGTTVTAKLIHYTPVPGDTHWLKPLIPEDLAEWVRAARTLGVRTCVSIHDAESIKAVIHANPDVLKIRNGDGKLLLTARKAWPGRLYFSGLSTHANVSLWCQSLYPVRLEEVEIPSSVGGYQGYSDHTTWHDCGTIPAVLMAGRGARVFERHVWHRELPITRDFGVVLIQRQFAKYIEDVTKAVEMCEKNG